MKRRYLSGAYLGAALVSLGLLFWLTITEPPPSAPFLPAALFGALIIFADIFGVRLAGGVVSLLPMTTVAAYLVMGPVASGWAALSSAVIHALLRYLWSERLQLPPVTDVSYIVTVGAANTTAHTLSVLAGGRVFRSIGGEIPLIQVAPLDALALGAFALTYFVTNHLIFVPAFAARGRRALTAYLRSLPNLIFYEGGPLILAPLMALIYTQLGVIPFVLFALSMVTASLITRSLARTSLRLERRLQELRGLQAVGRALSASLDIEAVVAAIYEEVARLMPARNFYVALYDPEVHEVSFPLAVEEGEPVEWRSRRTGTGLTEHVLGHREPLLIEDDMAHMLRQLGVDSIGQPAKCWLGVPILAGEQALGVIAVQSYDTAEAYDGSHQRLLTTIAAQAAVAVQNARLYARTDEMLARRVQELDSILRTAREGILLLDLEWRIVAANRALASLLDVAQLELSGRILDTVRGDGKEPLIQRLGYKEEGLRADCQSLRDGTGEGVKQAVVTLPGSDRHVERTLTPVRSQEDRITGWLMVLRDVTGEIELARLKDDMTSMLVHDLRSPLTVLGSSFTLMEEAFTEEDEELFAAFTDIAQRSTERMLNLVNGLLGVTELESDELELRHENVDVEPLLQETASQLAPLASLADITIEISVDDHLPRARVDVMLIRRVLNNLLDNAIKFAPDGSCVRLWARRGSDRAPEHLLVGVSDEGPGVSEEEQERLFDKFYRVSSVTGRRSGSGLGLPFCKLAVEAHGGRIWAESPSAEVGSAATGTTFVMTVPIGSADHA